MADRAHIPAVADAAKDGPPVLSRSAGPDESTVPARPAWMNSGQVKLATPRPARKRQSAATTPPAVEVESEERSPSARTRKEQILEWLLSSAATGYGLSLLFHFLVLLGMAFWVFPQIAESTGIITVVESDVEEPQPFDAMDDVHLEKPAGSESIVVPQLTEVFEQESELNLLEHKVLEDVTAADTQGEGGASDIGSGGFRLLEPKNAVKAGSFTAWTIPIARNAGEKPQAGDSPRPGQDYHIVIQVKIPEKRNAYSISDLSGKVIGTDGYIQIIPAQAFTQDENGRMRRAQLGHRLPIIDGVVQLVIRVPGAEALVKDTIRIKSKLLKENQTLELIFGKLADSE